MHIVLTGTGWVLLGMVALFLCASLVSVLVQLHHSYMGNPVHLTPCHSATTAELSPLPEPSHFYHTSSRSLSNLALISGTEWILLPFPGSLRGGEDGPFSSLGLQGMPGGVASPHILSMITRENLWGAKDDGVFFLVPGGKRSPEWVT